jgi:hypothetical protein
MNHHIATMTIGEVIDALEKASPNLPVYFDFGGIAPTDVDSWRGIYAEAALGFRDVGRVGSLPTAAELLEELRESIDGRSYTGWKGGEYTYDRSTPLHIDNPGCYTCTALVGVEADEYRVLLRTELIVD